MELGDSIRGLIEDTITEGLYELYPEDVVDKFLKNYDDDTLSTEMLELIEDLSAMASDRIDELEGVLNKEDETEYED